MRHHILYLTLLLLLFSCGNNDDPVMDDEMEEEEEVAMLTDDFDGTGPLVDYVTNNESALPDVQRVNGRYRANLTNNANNVTLHFNAEQGRLDAKLLSFPFEFVARNIGIGTQADSQTPPTDANDPYNFAGVQVHVSDLASANSAHVVVGHRGPTGFTIEGKNTVDGNSSVNDIGEGTVPQARADIRIVGNSSRELIVYWQLPNLDFENSADTWTPYNGTGALPGNAPTFGSSVYVGLITYAFELNGVPFVGTCDAIDIN